MGTNVKTLSARFALVVVGISMLLQPAVAFAITIDPPGGGAKANDWTLTQRAQQWALAQAFTRCIAKYHPGGAGHDVTESELASGNWFTGFGSENSYTVPSFLAAGDHDDGKFSKAGVANPNGVMECNVIAHEVAATWVGDGKFSSMEDLFCTVYNEHLRDNGTACRKSNGGSGDYEGDKVAASFVLAKISEKVWGTTVSIDDAGRYIIYRAAFNEFCKPVPTDSPAAEYKYVVKEYDTAVNKIIETTYGGSRKNTSTDSTYVYAIYDSSAAFDPIGARETCKSITDSLNKYASAYGLWAQAHPEQAKDAQDLSSASGSGDSEAKSTCNIEGGMSWIICPVMNTLASINDTAFSALKNFLEIDAKVITNNDIKGAWEKFRDIANVAFIGAFLIVIYSQMTGTGISNYGIKKIIPRIVVAAVLINISFWVCALMVDISNIVGSSIYNLLGDSINIGGGDSGHEGWNAVVGGLLTGGIVIALVAALIFAPTVLLAVAVVLIILIARQAFVILLIAMSPLAFTAYLLPNTEQWFKKWWKAFVAVLMVYPTVGLVFGASTLASRVLGTSDDKLMQVAALAIMGIPLFAVPALLKGAMSAAGSIGQKLAGLQDRANRAAGKRIKNRAGEFGKDMSNRWKTAAMDPDSRLGKSKLGSYSRWRNRRDRARKDREGAAERAASYSYSNAMVDKDDDGNYTARAKRLQKSAAGGIGVANEKGMARVEALATQAAHKQFDENVSAFKTMHSGKSNKQILDELEKGEGSDEYLASLAGTIMSRDHRDSHVDALRIMGKKAKDAESAGDKNAIGTISNIQKQMSSDMKDKPWALGDQAAGQLVNGTYGLSTDHNGESQPQLGDIDSEMKERVGKKLSAQGLANMNPDEMRAIYQMAQGTHSSGLRLDDTELANLNSKIEELRNSRYKDDVKPEAKQWHDKILQDAAYKTYEKNIR